MNRRSRPQPPWRAGGGLLTPERSVLRLARPHLNRLAGAGLLAASTDIAGLGLMATATWLLMTAADSPPLDTLTVAIVAVRALAIGRGVLRYTERLAGHDAVLRIVADVRTQIFAALAARPGSAGERSGDVLSRLVSDVEAVQDLLLRVLVPAAAASTVGLLAVAGAAAVSPTAALVLATGLLLAGAALPAAATGLTRRTACRLSPLRGALAVDTVDLTHGAADLAAFGATDRALDRAGARARELARLERRLAAAGWAVDGAGVLVAGATAAGAVAAGMSAGVDGVLVGVLAVGTLAAVETTLALVGAARQWAQLRPGLGRVTDLLAGAAPAAHPGANDHPAGLSSSTGHQRAGLSSSTGHQRAGLSSSTGHQRAGLDGGTGRARRKAPGGAAGTPYLSLDTVTVHYRAGAAPALDTVSLDLPPGRRIAVVGPSGAGKSTLLGVLTGAVAPTAGRATLDGADLSGYDELPRAVGGLFADAHVFHASVRDNLRLGRPAATDDELAVACAAAGLLDWIRDQPAEWDTLVGEDGAALSGGQRQRLVLARAVLAAPTVLLLDEPTEGLDPAAADAVLGSTLAATPQGRSVVLVTHRLHGLDAFDEIIVLDGGRIVRRGRHTDLVKAPGYYRDQWLRQRTAEIGYAALAASPDGRPGSALRERIRVAPEARWPAGMAG